MAAYLIVDVSEISDPDTYALYRAQVAPGLTEAGGAYLVRGGEVQVLEGAWKPGRIVVVRFDSADAARAWWNSPSYEALKRMRQASTSTSMILVKGIDQGGAP